MRPTTNVLIGIVFTLSECSPNAASLLSPSPGGPDGASHGGGGGGGDGGNASAKGGGSGLTAGTDALRLACLQCLEVTKRVTRRTDTIHDLGLRRQIRES